MAVDQQELAAGSGPDAVGWLDWQIRKVQKRITEIEARLVKTKR